MRLLPPLAVLAGAVLLFFLPGFVNGRRNDEGIAWTAPKGKRITAPAGGAGIRRRRAASCSPPSPHPSSSR
jgi:hypothetical protein